jgi:hypothetical protein
VLRLAVPGQGIKNTEVLGSGCRDCETNDDANVQAAQEMDVDYGLARVADVAEIMSFGMLSTPGEVADGNVAYSGGGIPAPDIVPA